MSLTIRDLDDIEKIVDEKIEEKISNLPTKDEFFTKMDEVVGELKGIRENQDILTNKVYHGLEERISKVESKLQIQPAL